MFHPENHTWVVDTGVTFSETLILEMLATPRSARSVSKKQWDQEGEDEANFNTAATGPSEIDDHISGNFWRMKAVPRSGKPRVESGLRWPLDG